MRIIGGTQKGFSLKRPKAAHVRPTTDMMKEALFNILQPVTGKTFLDVFAGTGSVGIEALSRGASLVIFVEQHHDLAKSITALTKQLGFKEHARVISMEMKKGLHQISELNARFDYVFIDPPYQKDLIEDTMIRLGRAGLVDERSLIVIQHSKREPVRLRQSGFSLEDQRTYGDSMLTFLKIKTQVVDN